MFSLEFDVAPQLEVGANAKVRASLRFRTAQESKEGTLLNASREPGESLYYKVTETPDFGMQIDLYGGFRTKVMWRDSSRNYFFSTSRDGLVSPWMLPSPKKRCRQPMRRRRIADPFHTGVLTIRSEGWRRN
jgi:hypothetical protein